MGKDENDIHGTFPAILGLDTWSLTKNSWVQNEVWVGNARNDQFWGNGCILWSLYQFHFMCFISWFPHVWDVCFCIISFRVSVWDGDWYEDCLPHINFVASFSGAKSPRITKALEIFDLTLVDCWANLYRSQDDIKSWHHDNYQDWTPRPPVYKLCVFFFGWGGCFFFLLGREILGEKTWRGMEGVPLTMYDVWYLMVKFLSFFGSGHHDIPREYFVCMFHVHPQMVRSA